MPVLSDLCYSAETRTTPGLDLVLTVVFKESPSPAVVGGDTVTIAVVTVVVQFILGYESMDRSSFLMVGLELGS